MGQKPKRQTKVIRKSIWLKVESCTSHCAKNLKGKQKQLEESFDQSANHMHYTVLKKLKGKQKQLEKAFD